MFKQIKVNIAKYFGLGANQIFFKNTKEQILLQEQRVLDELYPMQSAKIRNMTPVLKLTFYKDLDTLQYILGDRREIEAQRKMKLEQDKRRKEDQEKFEKNKEKRRKEKEI